MDTSTKRMHDTLTILVGFGLVVAVIGFTVARNIVDRNRREETTENGILREAERRMMPLMDARNAVRTYRTKNAPAVLDFRDEASFEALHIPGSTRVDADTIDTLDLEEGTEVLIVAAEDESSHESVISALERAKLRYSAITDGLPGWEAAGGSIITFGDPTSPNDHSKVTLVNADQFDVLLKQTDIRYRLLDVRSGTEALPGAIRIPTAELESRYEEIPPATNIALCGDNGLDAFQAAVRLFDLGFYSVRTLDGGCPTVTR